MGNFDSTISQRGGTMHVVFAVDGRPLRFCDALASLQSNVVFRDYLTGVLAGAPFAAFRWETPSLSQTTLERPFECVLIDAPDLERPPDAATFASHFTASDCPEVVSFDNLSRTATLIVPRGLGDLCAYSHLARFLRSAPAAQIDALWRCVGEAASRRVSPRRQWLSTAGAGVAWLHVRIDDVPKYYLHRSYAVGM